MKNFLKKLHIGSDSENSSSSKGNNRFSDGSPIEKHPHSKSEHNPFSKWLNSVTNRHNSSPPNVSRGERIESSDSLSLESALDAVMNDSGSRDPDIEEEYQIQLALELSAKEDPEAVQIEAVKQMSLGSCQTENSAAEVAAYRYWSYNALSYDDKILDGFYDLYGFLNSSIMPSLVDLQGIPMSDDISWEAIVVDKSTDAELLNLEQKALQMDSKLRPDSAVLVQKLATLVSDHMGGPVGDLDKLLIAWRNLSNSLKEKHGGMVLPIGSLAIGLARHRALLFKVLADSLGIPCRLVKGREFTGSDDVAMNLVKIEDGREYIVDTMSDPGTLIPSDAALNSSKEVLHSHVASSSSSVTDEIKVVQGSSVKDPSFDIPNRPYAHARSPSWTEGVSSPAVRRMKAKDVSQYMMDAAKENPQLAQKLHDVLLESGVVAPPNLFTEMCEEEPLDMKRGSKMDRKNSNNNSNNNHLDRSFLPPLPRPKSKMDRQSDQQTQLESLKLAKSTTPLASAVAAAAVAAASSMLVANLDAKVQLPVAAATATVTAAAVVGTTASVASKQNERTLEGRRKSEGDKEVAGLEQRGNDGNQENEGIVVNTEGERISDKSTGNESSKSDVTLDDVADCEIQWEEITMGERIGLGSYGEVYRGDWHGTEVAVKKFLDQDLFGESLEEFVSEVQIMKRLRHPNVVLFMGAVTRPPNLSIVTEFLPRGSLYRLIHRPNNQLDERRRLRMAFDAARGLNYLHNCTPVIVHRDLKSPNLLVDKNWVVKVCDFGLSRMKHNTYLSSRSTAGTAEWMAPEVLRNEPSNEKCDVYSFGVILWELCTLQQPWGGMNPMQVVGAVGFQHRRLDIPDYVDPVVADIIRKCWQTDQKLRPSFAEIMAVLKPLQKPITGRS